jgi:tetratricopeptide (TPR) repeat protein
VIDAGASEPSAAGFSRAWYLSAPLLVLAAFWPCLGAGFVNFDDDFVVLHNPWLRELSANSLRWMFSESWIGHWTPLAWISLALNHAVHGLDPFGYHLVNVALHALNAWLAAGVFEALLARAAPQQTLAARRSAALAAALLFALHPLRVESVAWITERRDVLSGAFWLGTLWAWLAATAPDIEPARRRRRLAGALVLFCASLLSKAWGITIPALLLVLCAWPLRRFGAGKTRVVAAELALFAVFACAGGGLAWWAQSRDSAAVSLADHTLVERYLQACYGVALYVQKSLWPSGLHVLYPLPREISWAEPRFLVPGLAVPLVTLALLGAAKRAPALCVAWCAFGITAAPILGFAQSGVQLAADRYTYLACLPFALLAAAGLARCVGARRGLALACALAAALGVATWKQCGYWKDSLALWERSLALEPDNYVALYKRGKARYDSGDVDGALSDYRRAIVVDPDAHAAWYYLGDAERTRGQFDAALAAYDRAIALRDDHPYARLNRGVLLAETGAVERALVDLDLAVSLLPRAPEVWLNRASARYLRRDYSGAAADIERALGLAPQSWGLRGAAEGLLQKARTAAGKTRP